MVMRGERDLSYFLGWRAGHCCRHSAKLLWRAGISHGSTAPRAAAGVEKEGQGQRGKEAVLQLLVLCGGGGYSLPGHSLQ